jgi:preprotein translocase subunit Sss1
VARKDFAIWWVTEDKEEGFIDNVVKSFVNWTLGILWLIALLMVLYGWFMMLTSRDSEDGYNKWWTILKNALIGLFIIGVAWFIISLIFWLIVQSGTWVEWANTEN